MKKLFIVILLLCVMPLGADNANYNLFNHLVYQNIIEHSLPIKNKYSVAEFISQYKNRLSKIIPNPSAPIDDIINKKHFESYIRIEKINQDNLIIVIDFSAVSEINNIPMGIFIWDVSKGIITQYSSRIISLKALDKGGDYLYIAGYFANGILGSIKINRHNPYDNISCVQLLVSDDNNERLPLYIKKSVLAKPQIIAIAGSISSSDNFTLSSENGGKDYQVKGKSLNSFNSIASDEQNRIWIIDEYSNIYMFEDIASAELSYVFPLEHQNSYYKIISVSPNTIGIYLREDDIIGKATFADGILTWIQ